MKKVNILTISVVALFIINVLMLFMMWNKHPHDTDERFDHPPFGDGGPPPERGPHHRGPGEFIQRELNFNETQQQQFKLLREAHHDSVKMLREQMKELKSQLFVFDEKSKNENSALKVATEIGGLQQKIELITYKHFAEVRALCNEEQKKKFDTIIKDVMRRMEPGVPPGMPPPPRE